MGKGTDSILDEIETETMADRPNYWHLRQQHLLLLFGQLRER
jgi:hypothetical protein